jgi:transcriptional regulator with XRE-family HTH domain
MIGQEDMVKTIRELREGQGWTQLELANKLGVTPATVYNWERGRYEPSASKLRALAGAFGVSMDDIALVEERAGEAAA